MDHSSLRIHKIVNYGDGSVGKHANYTSKHSDPGLIVTQVQSLELAWNKGAR